MNGKIPIVKKSNWESTNKSITQKAEGIIHAKWDCLNSRAPSGTVISSGGSGFLSLSALKHSLQWV